MDESNYVEAIPVSEMTLDLRPNTMLLRVAICHFHFFISLIKASYLKSGALIPALEGRDSGIRRNSPPEKWPVADRKNRCLI